MLCKAIAKHKFALESAQCSFCKPNTADSCPDVHEKSEKGSFILQICKISPVIWQEICQTSFCTRVFSKYSASQNYSHHWPTSLANILQSCQSVLPFACQILACKIHRMKEISFCYPYLFNKMLNKYLCKLCQSVFCHLHAKILACKTHSMQVIACCAPFFHKGCLVHILRN